MADQQPQKLFKAQTLKGFRDYMPELMAPRQAMIRLIEATFERHGFQPLVGGFQSVPLPDVSDTRSRHRIALPAQFAGGLSLSELGEVAGIVDHGLLQREQLPIRTDAVPIVHLSPLYFAAAMVGPPSRPKP